MSGAAICPRCRCFSFGRREALPLRWAIILALVDYVRPHQNLGGEFSSLYQNSFHHYRDFWCFDITTRSWDRIETKVRPSARSGHRFDLPYFSPSPLSLNRSYLEWLYGSTTSSSLGGFMTQASQVSAPDPAPSSEVKHRQARYMNDLWIFDTQEYRWQQIEYKDPNERRPS